MHRKLFTSLILNAIVVVGYAQVGIGTTTPKAFFNVAEGKTVLFGSDTSYVRESSKLIWYASKGAFRAGYVDNIIWDQGDYIGPFSSATGHTTRASGYASTAMGLRTNARGDYSTAMGYSSTALGISSTAMGVSTQAIGTYDIAMGQGTTAFGTAATAMGNSTTSSGYASTAMGSSTRASGTASTAIGFNANASGEYSTAIGFYTVAPAAFETVIGTYNTTYEPGPIHTDTNRLFTIGNGTADNLRSNALTVLKNGNVGIGTSLPGNYAKVEIQSTVTKAISSQYRYMNINGEGNSATGSGDRPYSLYTSGRIWCGDEINVTSDQRTKTTITSSRTAEDLLLVNQLRVVDYTYVDKVAKGNTSIKGFLAQQVETVFPEAVSQTKGIVPTIYQKADKLLANTHAHTLTLSLSKSHGLLVGNRVKLITVQGESVAEVSEVTDTSFTVSNWEGTPDWVFVYGQEVEDLRNIDYNKIFSAGISAIQELSKKVEKLEAENSALRNENTSVKSETALIKSDMEEIKKQLATLLKQ